MAGKTTRPNIKIRPETKEKFLSLKEKLEKEKGKKLSQDYVLTYLLSKASKVAVEIDEETRNNLEKLRWKLEEVTGNPYSIDDAVNFLFYYFIDDPCCEQGERKNPPKEDKDSIRNILQRKKEFFTSFFGEQDTSPITYDEIASRIVFVPQKIMKKIKEKSNGNPPLIFLLTAAEQGAEIYGRFLGVVENDSLNAEVVGFLNSLPPDLKEKFIAETQKRFQTVVKETLKRFKKKNERKMKRKG